jgi:hypothetical protein
MQTGMRESVQEGIYIDPQASVPLKHQNSVIKESAGSDDKFSSARKLSQAAVSVFAKGGVRTTPNTAVRSRLKLREHIYPAGMSVNKGDKVQIMKQGSNFGKIATVIDPEWQGMVKVKLDGDTKSYELSDLILASKEDIEAMSGRKEKSGRKKSTDTLARKKSTDTWARKMSNDEGSMFNKVSNMVGEAVQTAQMNRNLDFVRRGYNDDEYRASRTAVKIAVRELLIYVIFMVIFGLSTSRYVFSSDLFSLGAGLDKQMTGTPYQTAEYYQDISSVEAINTWMLGPLNTFLFTHKDARPLGYNFFLGPVRVAQVRAQEAECGHGPAGHVIVPEFMRANSNRSFTW